MPKLISRLQSLETSFGSTVLGGKGGVTAKEAAQSIETDLLTFLSYTVELVEAHVQIAGKHYAEGFKTGRSHAIEELREAISLYCNTNEE